MANQPQLTVSGYRGIWGESLTAEIARDYARAFIKFVKENINQNPTILIGRDGRESGPEIKKVIIKEFENLGVKYVDGDILPTPTVLFAVRKHKYDGAIIITASHNPREYNGLKFVTNKALFTSEEEVVKIKQVLQEKIVSGSLAQTDAPSRENFEHKIIRADGNNIFWKEHVDQIIAHIDVASIRARKFKVAVDMINASACVLDPYLFEQLDVELVPLNNIPNGKFAHTPEPVKENLADIAQLVKSSGADLGFAHDPDADRLVIINEKGEIISEEYTLAFGVEAVLSQNPNNKVAVNMSTSNMSADIAKKYGSMCIRTKVGEANVVAGIIENNATIGGEGGGGIIYPAINMARDSFTSLALILEILAKRNQTVSECANTLPKYEMRKDKLQINGDLKEIYKKIKSNFNNENINEKDGIRIDFKDSSWIHLRPSNTEPIIRLIGEARTKERIDEIFKSIQALLA